MGLFDAIKSVKNAVTGGSAKVFVDIPAARLTEPFQITVRAVSQGGNVKFSRVYLKIEGVESVEVPDYDIVVEANGTKTSRRETVRKSVTTTSFEVTVSSAGELASGQTGEWTTEVRLPAGSVPEFKGQYAKHGYLVFAGLDCWGNDPDSGWVGFRVS